MAEPVADNPQALITRAREMLSASGRPMNAENLNRAMLYMRGAQDEGYVGNVAESGATGRSNTPRRSLPMPPAQPPGPPVSQDVMQDMPQPPPPSGAAQVASPSPAARTALNLTGDDVVDPMSGVTISRAPERPGIGTPQSNPPGTASAATIAPNGGSTRQSTPPAGGTVTGPAAATPSNPNAIPVNRADLTPTELQELQTNPRFTEGPYDQIIGQIMSGLMRGRGRGAPGLRLPGGPVPAGQSVPEAGEMAYNSNTVRVNPSPPQMYPAQDRIGAAPPALPPGASPPPSLPPGPVTPMLPGGGGPASPMLAAPPATPRVGGPPPTPRLQTDRGSTGRTQDTRAARDRALSQELRSRNRDRYGAPDTRE